MNCIKMLIGDVIFQTHYEMLSLERSLCWANVETLGLLIGFSRIILISNMIRFRTLSLTIRIFIEATALPRKFITNKSILVMLICNKFPFFPHSFVYEL